MNCEAVLWGGARQSAGELDCISQIAKQVADKHSEQYWADAATGVQQALEELV